MISPEREDKRVRTRKWVQEIEFHDKVHQAVTETEAMVTGEGMEETLVGESSLGGSSSEAEIGEDEPGEVQEDPDDFFAGLS